MQMKKREVGWSCLSPTKNAIIFFLLIFVDLEFDFRHTKNFHGILFFKCKTDEQRALCSSNDFSIII